jgi:opacity protein-like surface antigen
MTKFFKFTKLLSATSLLFIASLTSAQADGWYGKLNLGYTSQKALDVAGQLPVIEIFPAPPLIELFDYKPGISWGGAIGYQMNMLRMEAEFGMNNLNFDMINEFDELTRTNGKSMSFMANGYLDFDMDAVLLPYVGVGVGYSKSTMGSTKDKYFAMQGMVGFNFELNENMLVGIEYRYKTSISGALYDTMASHSGILSIRANF